MTAAYNDFFRNDSWYRHGEGARYIQLSRHIARAIRSGQLEKGRQLPPERDFAQMADVSRVTVRKAVAELTEAGLVEQRRSAGSFVVGAASRTEQSLSSLVSFSENMQARGRHATSKILDLGIFRPAPDEIIALGLSSDQQVARINRLRSADGAPMAIERSSLPSDILPDPHIIETSLYATLRSKGLAPSKAIQRVTAINITGRNAQVLGVPEQTAILQIDRTAYLSNGRPIEFTQGYYRPDIYDFIAELRPDTHQTA